ncbi:MAG: S-methyl-5-thioribose-1-phosphate isomerase [Myxococcota bacterium]
MKVAGIPQRTVVLDGAEVDLIDQPRLPHAFARVRTCTVAETADAIRTMVVRGAGAIGATAAAGMGQAAALAPTGGVHAALADAARVLRNTRPTAQNLFYGIDRVLAATVGLSDEAARHAAVREAHAVADEDAAACEALGEHGQALIRDGMRIATHCNAGWLAFVDWGSALSPIYKAHRAGRSVSVWVDETRPRGQGAQLTAWELGQEGIPHHVVADGALASLMRAGEVDLVITGSDRVAANGDVANKIGTYGVAVAAHHHGIPFYVALPTSTMAPDTPDGAAIPIEERGPEEVQYTWGSDDDGTLRRVRTTYSPVRNPAFDVTPAELVAGFITQYGIFPASPEGVRAALSRGQPSKATSAGRQAVGDARRRNRATRIQPAESNAGGLPSIPSRPPRGEMPGEAWGIVWFTGIDGWGEVPSVVFDRIQELEPAPVRFARRGESRGTQAYRLHRRRSGGFYWKSDPDLAERFCGRANNEPGGVDRAAERYRDHLSVQLSADGFAFADSALANPRLYKGIVDPGRNRPFERRVVMWMRQLRETLREFYRDTDLWNQTSRVGPWRREQLVLDPATGTWRRSGTAMLLANCISAFESGLLPDTERTIPDRLDRAWLRQLIAANRDWTSAGASSGTFP